jgi:hypothetical protein
MRRLIILVVLGVALAVGAEANPPKPTNTPKPTITKAQAPKGGASKGATATGPASKGSTMKATGAHAKGSTVKVTAAQAKRSTVKAKGAQATVSSGKSAKPTKSDTKLAKADAKAPKTETKSAKVEQKTKKTNTASSGTSASTSNTTSTTRTSTAPIDFTATALGQKLQKNSAIRSKIEAKLQAAGYSGSVYEAAYGFKNLGQLNAATNQVQNQGYSFNLLKVLMTGTYVDPRTHVVYRANQLPDGTVNLVRAGLATNPASTQSLGQAKQAIAGGAEMPDIDRIHTSGTTTTNAPSSPSGVTLTSPSSVSGTSSTISSTTASKGKSKSK